MKYFHSLNLYFFLLAICFSAETEAQLLNTFNINIDNGLPTNYTYGIITDRFGYLWIATEKGVVKYNGYDCKLFNLSDGLPTEDVWQVLEDKKGRIWLGNISDEIGYIYNNKYHKTYLKGITGTMYPKGLTTTGDGIMFVSQNISGENTFTFCVEKNDTINHYKITESILGNYAKARTDKQQQTVFMFTREFGAPLIIYNNSIYTFFLQKTKLKVKKLVDCPAGLNEQELLGNMALIIGDNFFSYRNEVRAKMFKILSLEKSGITTVKMTDFGIDESVNHITHDTKKRDIYAITDNNILQLNCDSTVRLVDDYPISGMVGNSAIDGSKVKAFLNDNFWGKCIGTTTNGVWISESIRNKFKPDTGLNLHDYKYLGASKESDGLWWNPTTGTIIVIDKKIHADYIQFRNIAKISSAIPYNEDTTFIAGAKCYWFGNHTHELKPVDGGYVQNMVSLIWDNYHSAHAITIFGFYKIKYTDTGCILQTLNNKRYREMTYDSTRGKYWAYNYDNIFIHTSTKDTLISKEKLSSFGITKVEKILIDNTYGNMFFKGTDNMTLYDPEKNSITELFKNTNLTGSKIFIKNKVLVVAGRFGISFTKIEGPRKLSGTVEYSNIKNINYNYVYDCQISDDKVLLNTDRGCYTVDMPTDNEIASYHPADHPDNYKFIATYRDSTFTVNPSDTVMINQRDLKLQFDIIRPLGNGKVKFACMIQGDSIWHELNSNEINLPQLHPGDYYDLSIIASDNVWRSDKIALHLYITPYWRQTTIGKRTIWTSMTILVLLLFATSVVVTRKLVLKASKQRNLRMQLELKSIHAQINPHFIFNSLNSALLLVSKNKMTEAYNHISKFSRLLRAYIKSSRNKFITIGEEINNLRDYLELQQVRFKNKFEYEFVIDDGIMPNKIDIPSLLLQPFVENAINHGILLRQEPGHLKIEFRQPEGKNEIICIIDDNGIGRRQSKINHEHQHDNYASYGDLLIKDLVSIFNQYEDMNINIFYTDKDEPLTGTTVTIQIKYPHHAK